MYNYQKAVCIASALLCLSATASAQQVTLRANNVTVKQAMNQLREKTGYTFVFSSTDVNTQRQVTVSATNADLSAVIEQILKGQKGIDYKIEGKNIIITKARHNGVKHATQQAGNNATKRLTGSILDENGDPMNGRPVTVDGRPGGTYTDSEVQERVHKTLSWAKLPV